MSKKSKRKNNLKESIILLLLLILLLVSSTYAWFTANETVKISTIDVTIAASNGLQISTDATTWKALIVNTDITTDAYTDNTNEIPESMVPVSTIGEVDTTTGGIKMFTGTVLPDGTTGLDELTAVAAPEGTSKFIAFDIFLKVDDTTPLNLTTTSGVVSMGDSSEGIKQASRIAFVIQGTLPAGSALTDLTALKADSAEAPVYIWEPNSNLHTAAAIAHANSAYGITGITTDTNGVGSGSIPYYGIKAEISDGILVSETNDADANSTYFASVTPDYITEADKDGVMAAEKSIFTLNAGITKVRVYMWIEGQDIDCENTASGTDIGYNLGFTVAE